MAKEQKKKTEEKKLSYEELEQLCVQQQNQLQERNRVNEIRDMIAICLEMLKYKDVLPEDTFSKVTAFLDRVIPVPKED